ncbi:MAG: hypothetical protein COZ98_02160, partial [Candidatus Omnitrophica bacterium CG_4_8_14_3_um_filter_43_15]
AKVGLEQNLVCANGHGSFAACYYVLRQRRASANLESQNRRWRFRDAFAKCPAERLANEYSANKKTRESPLVISPAKEGDLRNSLPGLYSNTICTKSILYKRTFVNR